MAMPRQVDPSNHFSSTHSFFIMNS